MKSIWSEEVKIKTRDSLDEDIATEVLIIGAGIAGILIGYKLKEKGLDPIIIEGYRTLQGNTKNTTAKITCQHDIIYSKIIKEFGKEKAIEYAMANTLAIDEYEKIIKEKNIECEFERKPSYIYSTESLDEINKELEAARVVGIDAEFTTDVKLPFKVKGALKFNNQAQFNPLSFLKEISKDLNIYENTRAIEVDEDTVVTNRGKIKAKHIVVATNYPFINVPGYYFLKMHQERSYVIALENAEDIEGMYIDVNKEGYSFRNYKNLLLLGGCSKRTGENEDGGCYEILREKGKELYPNSNVKYMWSNQDCMTLDGIPYIGRYSKLTPNIYVATGFNKWGMTSAMVSAFIISDMILGKKNKFEEIFSPTRFDLSSSIKNLFVNGVETAKNFVEEKVHIPLKLIDDVKLGEGKIIEYNNSKVGVYKEIDGRTFILSTKCSHLGCELKWNKDELCWECPCHGSRFDCKGEILNGPAVKKISKENAVF